MYVKKESHAAINISLSSRVDPEMGSQDNINFLMARPLIF